MTEIEAYEIIDLVKGYWPKWEIEGSAFKDWVFQLRRFDFHKCKKTLFNIKYMDWKKQGNPPEAVLFARLKQECLVSGQGSDRKCLLYQLARKGQTRGYRFCSFTDNPDIALKEAENEKHRLENIYGCEFHIIRSWEDQEDDPKMWGAVRLWLEDKIWRRDHNEEPGPKLSEMIEKMEL